jgi:mannan endo-1,4-beta-mannosidase
MGDAPHEPQGWYGNFDSDTAKLEVIRVQLAAKWEGLAETCPA